MSGLVSNANVNNRYRLVSRGLVTIPSANKYYDLTKKITVIRHHGVVGCVLQSKCDAPTYLYRAHKYDQLDERS